MEFEHTPADDTQPKFRRTRPATAGPVAPKPPPKFAKGFPTRENCDPNSPYEFALWALVALPGQNGGQLVMPVDYLQLVSQRLWELGFRHVEAPKLKYRKPGNLDPHWLTSPGTWVPVDTPDDDPRTPTRRVVDELLPMQKAELFREISKDLSPRERFEFLQKIMRENDPEYTQGFADDITG